MTDSDIPPESPDLDTPRRLYNRPDSWIDLCPADPSSESAEQPDTPPRYVVLERQVVWSGTGCAGCLPGCLAGFVLGLASLGIGFIWLCQRIFLGIIRLLRLR